MDSVFISIIVPVYEAEKYLSTCIESILNQTFKNFELILVEDGSPDNSGLICDEYALKDSRIKVFHKENGGVSSARNIGIDNACGKWISFIDADDWVESNYCESLFSIEKKCDLIYFNSIHHYNDGLKRIIYPEQKDYFTREDIENALFLLKTNSLDYDYFGFTWNKFFKADIIKNNRIYFTESLSIREDEIFTANYSRYINSLTILSEPLYNYRILLTGLTARKKRVPELLLLANKIEEGLSSFTTPKLLKYEKKRIVEFKCMAIEKLISPFEIYNLYKDIHNDCTAYRSDIINCLSRKNRFLFTTPIFITFPIYMMIKYLKIGLKKLIR